MVDLWDVCNLTLSQTKIHKGCRSQLSHGGVSAMSMFLYRDQAHTKAAVFIGNAFADLFLSCCIVEIGNVLLELGVPVEASCMQRDSTASVLQLRYHKCHEHLLSV